jgi:colanic acid biosynthesis glycosyl transferase WcaI
MPKALLFYHYFYPDDVSSARHLTELAQGLVRRGWEVTAMPSNRGCRDESRIYPRRDEHEGIRIRRVWRPNLRQASSLGRLSNAAWMIARWSLAALTTRPAPDVVIAGTDPVLSVLVAPFWKLARRKAHVVHWCFDLYPEAAVADGWVKPRGAAYRLIQRLVGGAYGRCDLIADIGSCMRARLAPYAPAHKQVTLTPWALAEPEAPLEPDPEERRRLFGDAALALMYSGTLGRAHAYHELLELARLLRDRNVRLVFSVRGNREQNLRDAVEASDTNISFCPFASAGDLERRLSAADVHVVSLRPEWTGMVVPSKFFGAIAAGRPVLFIGSHESAVSQWIETYGLGWVLTPDKVAQVAGQMIAHMNSSEERAAMRRRCYDVYRRYFSRDQVLDAFDHELRELLGPKNAGSFSPVTIRGS